MNRRGFVQRVAAAAALSVAGIPVTARASAAHQEQLIALQRGFLSFDVRVVANRVMTALRVPRRVARRVDRALASRETGHGFDSIRTLMEDDALTAEMSDVAAWFTDTLPGKLWLMRRAKSVPASAGERTSLKEALYEMCGLELAHARAAVQALPTQELAIVYGPVRDLPELGSLLLREPYALLAQLAHGTRATEVHLDSADPVRTILDVLLDPSVRRVQLTGHGSWRSFVLYGVNLQPAEIEADLARRARTDTKRFLRSAGRGVRALTGQPYQGYHALEEEELATLLGQLCPTPEARAALHKDLIVKHTCGHGRYGVSASLLWSLLPESIEARVAVGWGGISAATPADQGRWEADFEQWLADKDLDVRERGALGECLTADRSHVRGFEGDSWLPDFVHTPIPPYRPPHPAWARPPEEPEPDVTAGAAAD